MNQYERFLGSKSRLHSRTWGDLTVEAVELTAAVDGDLVVHVGQAMDQPIPLVRIHSECIFSQVFDSDLCDCAEQLQMAMDRIVAEKHGLLFYLRLEGRGAGLAAKVAATHLQTEGGMDTYDAHIALGLPPEGRDFSAVGSFLKQRGVTRIRLMTSNPAKISAVEAAGVAVEVEPLLVCEPSQNVLSLYRTKARKFGHLIPNFRLGLLE